MCYKYCAASGCYEKIYGSATYCSKHNNVVTASTGSVSLTTTRQQREGLYNELADQVKSTGLEYEAKIQVTDERGRSVSWSAISRPPRNN